MDPSTPNMVNPMTTSWQRQLSILTSWQPQGQAAPKITSEPLYVDIEEIQPISPFEVHVYGCSPSSTPHTRDGQWFGTCRLRYPQTLYEVLKEMIYKWSRWGSIIGIKRNGSFLLVEATKKSYYLKSDFGWDRIVDTVIYIELGYS